MENQLIEKFNNYEIRIIKDEEGIIWFVAKDICSILDVKNTSQALDNIPNKNKNITKVNTTGGPQSMATINKEGLKNFLISSRKNINQEFLIFLKEKFNIELNTKFYCKQTSYGEIIKATFKHEDIKEEYKVGKYRVDFYMPVYKLVIECDEYDHDDRDLDYERVREKYIMRKLDCNFIRFNPDENNFNIGKVLRKIIKIIYENE